MTNHGLTTIRTIPSTAGAQDKVREVNTLPPKEPDPTTAEPVDWNYFALGLGTE